MLASAWLSSWIAAPHLTPNATRALREAYATSPARAVVLDDLLVAPVAARLGRFLTDQAEFRTGLGLRGRYGYVTEEDFLAAPASERFFRYGRLARATGAALQGEDFQTFERINRALADPRTRAFFEAITGVHLGAATLSARSMRRGDFLVPHTDDIGERLVSFVIYLSPAWRPEDGGTLMLEHRADPAGDPAEGATGHFAPVEPRFNRMVVFGARTWHHLTPIEAPPDRARVTLGGWFLVPA